jgi:hypothetical protein
MYLKGRQVSKSVAVIQFASVAFILAAVVHLITFDAIDVFVLVTAV